ncbi:DUF1343 domain-containing protein [Robiginitalea sp. M366]|uniref:exo-beta-N-acetylmuramidase NamZ family protein n=1 Tax=Robiginitalea aestuariiviva TaxID=3036903 RepID=UPI00240E4A8B|nr:DUF1343 domain-containing protein [Robiginitalea aestuariiviva]MDG1572166.1 DUF1343 domain-containing protein [Robiginitalea aestuariiviva]
MHVLAEIKNTLFVLFLVLASCRGSAPESVSPETGADTLCLAAQRTEAYFPLLRGKRLGLVANQTTVIFRPGGAPVHLADSLLGAGMDLVKVFAPEHGFRGQADAGEHVQDGTDIRTGLPIVSLYGSRRKPAAEDLEGLDLVVFDIQDLGVRFYTYIATLQLVMEACAEAGIPVLVLDRPNPNADYVDGPIMEPPHTSFLGMTPIPLAYGMTLGEYAEMLNGEGWLEGGLQADLTVIPLEHYRRGVPYDLPIAPSPNIPNTQAARLYPSLGLFEGTTANAGRGTDAQFQRFGAPYLDSAYFDFRYTPAPNAGAKYPKQEGKTCYGRDLSQVEPPRAVDLTWLLEAYNHRQEGSEFFNTSGFTRHAGTETLQQQIEAGLSMAEIRASWQEGLEAFREVRKRYLRYP